MFLHLDRRHTQNHRRRSPRVHTTRCKLTSARCWDNSSGNFLNSEEDSVPQARCPWREWKKNGREISPEAKNNQLFESWPIMNRCWGMTSTLNHTYMTHTMLMSTARCLRLLLFHLMYTVRSGWLQAAWPGKDASGITVEKNKVADIVRCVFVCLWGSVSERK